MVSRILRRKNGTDATRAGATHECAFAAEEREKVKYEGHKAFD